MKTHLLIVFSLVFLAACSATQIIRKKSNDAKVQDQLEALFAACQDQDYTTAAASIVYRGNDEARRWKDVSNYEAEDEKNYVDRVCKDIRGLLAGSDSYAWGAYLEEAVRRRLARPGRPLQKRHPAARTPLLLLDDRRGLRAGGY